MTIHYLCKVDYSPLDTFSEIGPTGTDTWVTAVDIDNRLNEMTKKYEERNTALSNQLENVQKLQTESVQNQLSQPQRGQLRNSHGQISRNGFELDGRFVNKVQIIQHPQTVEELDRFCGMIKLPVQLKLHVQNCPIF